MKGNLLPSVILIQKKPFTDIHACDVDTLTTTTEIHKSQNLKKKKQT